MEDKIIDEIFDKYGRACSSFYDKFKYFPALNNNARIDSMSDCDEYCVVIEKCIKDGVDYTIERYGTKPPKHFGLSDIMIN